MHIKCSDLARVARSLTQQTASRLNWAVFRVFSKKKTSRPNAVSHCRTCTGRCCSLGVYCSTTCMHISDREARIQCTFTESRQRNNTSARAVDNNLATHTQKGFNRIVVPSYTLVKSSGPACAPNKFSAIHVVLLCCLVGWCGLCRVAVVRRCRRLSTTGFG